MSIWFVLDFVVIFGKHEKSDLFIIISENETVIYLFHCRDQSDDINMLLNL